MTELSNLGTNSALAGTTYLVGVNSLGTSGIPGNLQTVDQVVQQGAKDFAAATTAAGTDTVLAIIGGVAKQLPFSDIPGAGGSVTITNGTLTLASGGTLTLGSGLTLSGTSAHATLTSAGGGGGLPSSAALLSTNSGGTATATSVGVGLTLTGGVLSANDVQPPFNDFHPGTLANGQTILRWILGQNYQAPSNTPNWIVSSGVTATNAATITLAQNGTTLCTGVVPAAGNQCNLMASSGFSGVVGDIVTLVGPSTADSTLADIAVLFSFGLGVEAPTTWNPFDKSPAVTLSGDNLQASNPSLANWAAVRGTNARTAGTVYWEITVVAPSTYTAAGLANAAESLTNGGDQDTNAVVWFTYNSGFANNGNFLGASQMGTLVAGDVMCFAAKIGGSGTRDIWIRRNNNLWNGDASADPVAGTHGLNSATYYNGALTALLTAAVYPFLSLYGAESSAVGNFGASAFAFSPPSGYTAWG